MAEKASPREKKPLGRRILHALGVVFLVLVLAVVWLFGWLTLGEYRPEERGNLEISGTGCELLYPGDDVKIMTWNIGYGALGDNADFFMDGGSHVMTADEARVQENIAAVIAQILAVRPDVTFLQEADVDSTRSHHINEVEQITEACTLCQSTFANNYRVMFVPYPMPPIGKVNSGLLTLSGYPISESVRVQLPCPFSWPIRTANLKRCLMIDRVPVNGTDKELVLVNLHLEAYDDGEGKIAQTEMLRDILQAEAAAGNYVVAGGDFNQIFSSIGNPFPSQEGMWLPGEIDVTAFSPDWQFAMDTRLPSCRSLDQPYAGADRTDFQYYLIDGFIVSRDLEILSLETQDLDFVNSDHNPVVMEVRLPAAY